MSLIIRLAAAAAAGLLIAACGGSAGPSSSSPPASPATSGPASAPASSPAATPAPTPAPTAVPFGYQPLYPFATLADAQAWQASYASGGHQPWHLSADATALAFTQGYLGFSQISKVAGHTISGRDAHVTVGLTLPNGQVNHAAIIHLVKYGSGASAPWEVVGTDDTTLTLDVPAYGGTATSPVKIGGKITGVDENLRAEVHQLGSAAPVGSYCCRPAGGQASAWSLTVPFRASTGQVITIVVHTGGHVAAVERFAVTGVRVG
jgi:acyl dehydratase